MVREFFHNLLLNLLVWLAQFRSQPRFREWVRLEEQKNKILKAVEESSDEFPNELFTFLSTALHFPNLYYRDAKWETVVKAFYTTLTYNSYKTELALFKPSSKKDDEVVAWNYEGRAWHVYAHLLAEKYNWTIEYISKLKLPDVLPLIQEILLNDQLEKEFLWTMSERSSYYDDKSKSAKANPLPRPEWMVQLKELKQLRITKTPTNMLPVGKALTVDDILKAETS